MTKKLIRKIVIVFINIIVLAFLFYFQNERFLQILNYRFVNGKNNEIVQTVKLMEEYGNSINWIIGISIILLFINFFLLKKWGKSKKWIIEGIFIFIITLILSITYNYQKASEYKIGMRTTANNT